MSRSSSAFTSFIFALQCYLKGVADSVLWHFSISIIWNNEKLRQTARKCLLLNGLLFMGMWGFFSLILQPFLIYNISLVSNVSDENINFISTYVLKLVYYVLWVYPIYAMSFILNSIWYQEIADTAYKSTDGKPVLVVNKQLGFTRVLSQRIADDLFALSLELVFAIQVSLIYLIPFVGPFISFICLAWLYSLYCFEYRWVSLGKPIEQRLEYIETRWAYFAGFGTTFAGCTFFSPAFINNGIFAMVFPLYIVIANRSQPFPPLEKIDRIGAHPRRLPIFYYASKLNAFIVKLIHP